MCGCQVSPVQRGTKRRRKDSQNSIRRSSSHLPAAGGAECLLHSSRELFPWAEVPAKVQPGGDEVSSERLLAWEKFSLLEPKPPSWIFSNCVHCVFAWLTRCLPSRRGVYLPVQNSLSTPGELLAMVWRAPKLPQLFMTGDCCSWRRHLPTQQSSLALMRA